MADKESGVVDDDAGAGATGDGSGLVEFGGDVASGPLSCCGENDELPSEQDRGSPGPAALNGMGGDGHRGESVTGCKQRHRPDPVDGVGDGGAVVDEWVRERLEPPGDLAAGMTSPESRATSAEHEPTTVEWWGASRGSKPRPAAAASSSPALGC